jgi:deoxyribose-phosphate aldolase
MNITRKGSIVRISFEEGGFVDSSTVTNLLLYEILQALKSGNGEADLVIASSRGKEFNDDAKKEEIRQMIQSALDTGSA